MSESIVLDGITFAPAIHEREIAVCDGATIGCTDLDEISNAWQARFGDGEWTPMRSRAEARSYVVHMHLNGGVVSMPFWRRRGRLTTDR